MYKFLNLHPEGKIVGDCVKRAIACAEGKPYIEVKRELNRLKKQTKCSSFNDRKNINAYMEKNGHVKLSFPAIKGESRMNGKRFCETFPRGRYILNMAGHLTACVDGVIYDTWDCSNKCVYNAWKVK